jgi:CIC family chloride channel protein
MVVLALLLGILSGLGAIAFHGLFAVVRNVTFLGHFSFVLSMNHYFPVSAWGIGVIVVPVLGALVVTWLIRNLGAEVEGSGVPEVLYAIYYRRGLIRPVVAMGRILATAVSAGTGASVGRDGPMLQMGAALSSTIGQIFRMSAQQRDVLIAAGAGGALAATFNAPVGSLTFTIELMLVSINPRSFSLVALSTLTGAYIGRLYFGPVFNFFLPPFEIFRSEAINSYQFLTFVPFGCVMGLLSYLTIQSIHLFRIYWGRLFTNPYLRHMSAMFLVGLILSVFMANTGRYYVEGLAGAPVSDIINNLIDDPRFLLLLLIAKFAVTVLALGSGASGGAFGPAMFMGASLGALVGNSLNDMFPGLGFEPTMFAIAGMASSIGSITGAAITGIVLVFERTRDYHAILPGILAVAMANVTRSYLLSQTIYTFKAYLRGYNLPLGLMAEFISIRRAKDAVTKAFQLIGEDELTLEDIDNSAKYLLVREGDYVKGFYPVKWVNLVATTEELLQSLNHRVVWLERGASWLQVLQTMRTTQAELIIIGDQEGRHTEQSIVGVIGKDEAVKAAQMTAALYAN